MAVRAEDLYINEPSRTGEPSRREGVRIIWKGKRIARFVFASGRIVEFTDGGEPRLKQASEGR